MLYCSACRDKHDIKLNPGFHPSVPLALLKDVLPRRRGHYEYAVRAIGLLQQLVAALRPSLDERVERCVAQLSTSTDLALQRLLEQHAFAAHAVQRYSKSVTKWLEAARDAVAVSASQWLAAADLCCQSSGDTASETHLIDVAQLARRVPDVMASLHATGAEVASPVFASQLPHIQPEHLGIVRKVL